VPLPQPSLERRRRGVSLLALLALLALAFLIRLDGIDWDDGRYLHPDERHIVADVVVGRIEFSWPPRLSWLDPDESPINPRPRNEDGTYEGFAYGTFPVYTVDVLGSVATELTGTDWTSYDRIEYIGRALSILLDTGTVLLCWLIGSRLFGRAAGFAAAIIYAFLPLAIQLSHFFTVDSWMTFFIFAAILTCIDAVRTGSTGRFALAGAWYGLAVASKATAAPLGGVILLALLLATIVENGRVRSTPALFGRFAVRASAALIVSVATFFVSEPFAFLASDAYIQSFTEQADIQSGTWDVPFTQQYVGTPRGAWQLDQLTRYAMGPVAVLLGLAGAGLVTWLAWRRRSAGMTLLLAWIVGFTLVVLYPETKFPRYALPLVPALAVCAGAAIVALALYLRPRLGKALAAGAAALILILSTSWGAAYAHVTATEHTRIAASVWLFENLPPGSTTTSEIWDDRLPMSLDPGHSSDARRIDDASINLYAYTPTLGDIATLGPALDQLPSGPRLRRLVEVGRVSDATDVLRSIAQASFQAQAQGGRLLQLAAIARQQPVPVWSPPVARFQLELVRAAGAMTTSGNLANDTLSIASTIGMANAITTDDLDRLAAAIDDAARGTMLSQIHRLLDDADYYVLSSDRVQRGMEQNPWRYAVPDRMYELLDSGELGYEPVRTFTSFPELFGVSFPDADADETFINYDHPVVRVYGKQDLVSAERMTELFGSAALAQTDPSRSPDTEPLTFDKPVSDLPDVTDARWSEPLTGNTVAAIAVWVVLLIALQIAAWPLASTVFRSFPDGGWGLTRFVGIIVPATVLWWLASTGVLLFRAAWVVVAFALFALATWLWLRPRVRAKRRWNMRMVAVAEAIFWVTFLIFLVFKLINPDSWQMYWGGEKPMEFAHINAILRSPSFPPVDPWYAQGYLNYYYYSFYLVAFLIKLTGIPIEYAFNLAQPLIMGVLASGTFSVGALLGNRLTRGRQDGLLSGLLAMVLVSFAGNMVDAAQMFDRFRGRPDGSDPFSWWVWNSSRAIVDTGDGIQAQLITEFPYFTGLYGDLHSHVVGLPLLVLCLALAASFALDGPLAGRGRDAALRARLALAAIALGIVYPTNSWDLPVTAALVAGGLVIGSVRIATIGRRLLWLCAAVVTIGAGAILVSLPFVLHFEALFGEVKPVRETTDFGELIAHAGGLLLVATAAIPSIFLLRAGRRRAWPLALLLPLLGAVLLLRWLAVDTGNDVRWYDVATVVIATVMWVAPLARLPARRGTFDAYLPRYTGWAVAAIGIVAVIALIMRDNFVAALYIGIAAGAVGAWLVRRDPAIRFVALMVAGAAAIGAGVEFVYLVDDLSGSPWARMNTIFKFYNEIWPLLAIAGGASAGVLITTLLARAARVVPGRTQVTPASAIWAPTAAIATAVVLVLASAYPIAATGIRLDARFDPHPSGLTLNAYDWMDYGTVQLTDGTVISFEEDRDVIDWFNTHVGGTPVIAEASFEPYRCNSSRISIGTGLPSVLGWQRHESQQRHSEVLPPRYEDLRRLYGSSSVEETLAIIDRYDIHYIVVGDLERSYPVVYGNDCVPMSEVPQYAELDLDAGIATFEQMEGETLEVAFRSGDTVVYRVTGNT
jgi:YYY domain-containing protein